MPLLTKSLYFAVPKGLDGLDEEEYARKVFYVWFDACSKLTMRI